MKSLTLALLCGTTLLLSACDTSINKQVEKKLEKAQHDALSPTGKLINPDEQAAIKSGKNLHGVELPDISGDISTDNKQDPQVLIPVEQFNNPQQTKLKNDALKWQEANLETYDKEGNTLTIDWHTPTTFD